MNEIRKPQDDKSRPAKGLQTDADISASANVAQRELQPWAPDNPVDGPSRPNGTSNGGGGDSETFGTATANIPWDQFETNARLFGTKTSYQEEMYTTKLNRAGSDFKKREKEAEKLASEIVNQTAGNAHLAEERNQVVEDWSKNEEEKYSGVTRNPNAYIPPGARRVPGIGTAALRPTPPPSTASSPAIPKTNGTLDTPATVSAVLSPSAPVAAASDPAAPQLERRTSDLPSAPDKPLADLKPSPSPQPQPAAGLTADPKDIQLGTVVDQFRQFVGTEREKVEAKKQSIAKTERDKQLADFKQFHTSFKVPLPMPKDMLPILAKDEEKQKAIEQKAANALESTKIHKIELSELSPTDNPKIEVPKPVAPKKMFMKILEIPPFNPTKRQPDALPVPATASQNIPLAISPTPSAASHGSGSQVTPKLNPNASTFVFKPNPAAAAFKPSTSSSPPTVPSQIHSSAAAGPSVTKNPFFRDQLPKRPEGINPRDDFNPWKHGQVPNVSSISPQWPYTGRKYHNSFGGPLIQPMSMGGFEDDPSSPRPGQTPMMHSMPPNFPPYGFRFGQPGIAPQQMHGQMQSNPMFSPGPGYAPLPGQMQSPQHMSAAHQHLNGMPLYYQNGMPQTPQFVPPQHMQYNPQNPQRQGPGPGPGGPIFYQQHQVTTPQQTPQMHHTVLHPPGQGQFSQGMQAQGPGGGTYDVGGQH